MLPLMPEYVARRPEPWRRNRTRGAKSNGRAWVDRIAVARRHRNVHIKPKAARRVSFKRYWRKNQGHPLLAEGTRAEKRAKAREMWVKATRTRAWHGKMLHLVDYAGVT